MANHPTTTRSVSRSDDVATQSQQTPLNLCEAKDSILFTFHDTLEKFIQSNDTHVFLPKYLTPQQKNYLLTLVQCMGLKIRSGRTDEAYVGKTNHTFPFVRMLVLAHETKLRIDNLLKLLSKESGKEQLKLEPSKPFSFRPATTLTCGAPQVPPPLKFSAFKEYRQSLPIFKYRQQILNAIDANSFCIIKGPIGCGKSTQVPQYILENAASTKSPIRILVCLPRRSAVIALSDRVAAELGETVGHTVGYQIRLENRYSPVETLVHFVCGFVVLRALATPGCHLMDTCTHIILDEVQCRERHQDFIMNCLQDIAVTKPHLKVIVMSEQHPSMDFLCDYLGGRDVCSEIIIQGPELQPVAIYHLEDILRFCWNSNGGVNTHYMYTFSRRTGELQKFENAKLYNIDQLIEDAWKGQDLEASLYDFLHLVQDDEISVDYSHSVTSVTMLMALCALGEATKIEQVLDMGANVYYRSSNGYTARDWAIAFARLDIISLLDRKVLEMQDHLLHIPDSVNCILREYFRKAERNTVDFLLIVRLIHMIHSVDPTNGNIIVFLPSYEDLTQLKNLICKSVHVDPGWSSVENPFAIHYLHEYIQTADQRGALETAKPGQRKIILSTEVGENCLTFPNTIFIIDSGRLKDSQSNFKWISKLQASQRAGRVGRNNNGICYRLYTRKCFDEEMVFNPTPEVTVCSLLVLCLQCRSLLGDGVSVEAFFEYLPTPPPSSEVRRALDTLKVIGAMHEDEKLSDLGMHLLDFAIDPKWAKALLYAVVFKCLDPILTIAAYMSYNDAFIPQSHPQFRLVATTRKLELAGETFSDHMAILKAFQKWESEKSTHAKNAQEFCEHNFISASTLDVVYGIRSRLLGQLRASGFIRNKGIHNVKDVNANSNNWAMVKAVLTVALYPNICTVNRVGRFVYDRENPEMYFHNSSILSSQNYDFLKDLPSDWVVYNEKVKIMNKICIKGCTVVNTATVALVAGDLSALSSVTSLVTPLVHGTGFTFSEKDRRACSPHESKVCLSVDNWIRMFSFDPAITGLLTLRDRIREIVLGRLKRPELFPSKMDLEVIDTVVRVLTIEDARVGLKQSSVGQWPKLVAGDLLSVPRSGFAAE